jgi:uncharacterized membrane protein
MKKRILAVLMLVLLFVSVTVGCTRQQKEDVFKKEGGDNAYIKKGSVVLTLSNPKNVTYSVKNVSGDYLIAAKYACSEVSKTSSGINIKATTYGSKDFRFAVAKKNKSENAVNNFAYIPSTGKILSSTITFYSEYMDRYTLAAKKMIAMHEMGHTLGLKDFYKGSLAYDNDATVMKGIYSLGYTVFTTYTEFDIANIQYKYGK